MKRIIVAILAAFLAIAMFAGCSSVSTDSDEVALHYSGGEFSSKKYQGCIDSSTRDRNGPGEAYYIYPKGQRTYSFTGKEGSESGPIPVTTGSQEVEVPGFLTFTLNTDCKTLRDFHEKIGKKYGAYKDGGGWDDFLNDYIYTPLDSVLNEAATAIKTPEGQTADQNWYRLYNNKEVQDQFEDYVLDNLPDEIETTLGEEFITVNQVSISKPKISEELRLGLEEKEVARLETDAQEERNTTAEKQYETLEDCLKTGVGQEACTIIFLSQNGADIPFIPVPQGGSINFQSSE